MKVIRKQKKPTIISRLQNTILTGIHCGSLGAVERIELDSPETIELKCTDEYLALCRDKGVLITHMTIMGVKVILHK